MNLKSELEARGFLNQYTNEELFDLYEQGDKVLYVGMDPTADSLHLGNFVGFMHAVQYMKRGNKLIFIVGGATGMIGDPGGKDSERSFLDQPTLEANIKAIDQQVQTILTNLKELSGYEFSYKIINNQEFYKDMGYIEFLREVGKYITINQMLNKETVKRRVEDPNQSISYTEFSYMLMQGYDFYTLYKQYDCHLQIAGSDQWGNVVTGVELVRKKLDQEAFGATCPLILDSTGKKFGKSEGNAIWLNPDKNSPFTVYQYFMNTADEDIGRYLKLFTLLSFKEIDHIIEQHEPDRSQRIGQQKLAYYVTMTVFGQEAADNAELITRVLFGSSNPLDEIASMSPSQLHALHHATGGARIIDQKRVLDIISQSGLCDSNGEAKKTIQSGALYLNENKFSDLSYELQDIDLLHSQYILLRKGKKNYTFVKVK